MPDADLGQTDEGGVSAGPERDNLVPELDPSGHRIELEEEDTDDRDVVQRWKLLKKHDISMPTIFLPAEMQKAVDSVLSCEWNTCRVADPQAHALVLASLKERMTCIQ